MPNPLSWWLSIGSDDDVCVLQLIYEHESSLYIYIKYIEFDWVGFYGISSTVGNLTPNPFYIYIKYIFGLVGYYGISNIVGYLMSNHLYTYVLNINDLIDLGFMAYQTLFKI